MELVKTQMQVRDNLATLYHQKNVGRCVDKQTSQEQCPTSPGWLDLAASSEGSE